MIVLDMNYREDWNLESIPDLEFYAEVGRRRGLEGGRKVTCSHDPEQPEKCEKCRQRKYRRERREKGLDRWTKPKV